LFGIHIADRGRTGGEVSGDGCGRAVDDDDGVVFLKRQRDLVIVVEIDELGLWVFAEDIGKASDIDGLESGRRDVEDDEEASRHLRQATIAQLFIALVFNGDSDQRAGLVAGDRVGLAAQIMFGRNRPGGDIDDDKLARGQRVAFGRVDAYKRLATDHG